MPQTIGNPLSWMAQGLGHSGQHLTDSARSLGSDTTQSMPQVRRLTNADLNEALRLGLQDFLACRTDVMFLVLLYPVIGILLITMGVQSQMLPMLFPMIAGFALLGPAAAVGVYEVSRRREQGHPTSWLAALRLYEHPSFAAILMLGFYLLGVFAVWMITASAIYAYTLGPAAPASFNSFLTSVFTTSEGWVMVIAGGSVGLLFAIVVLAVSLVSFPMLLDRRAGLPISVATSLRLTRENPGVVLRWGAMIAAGLVLGSIPALLGLIVILPVFGHATWHLYRRAVV
jgi:uncharacterized membrane protein